MFVDKINIMKSDLGLHDFPEMGPKYGIIRVSVDLSSTNSTQTSYFPLMLQLPKKEVAYAR